MKKRSMFFALLTIAAIVFFVGANKANAQSYSGQGTAAKVTVTTPGFPVLTNAVADTGPLPSAGGDIPITSAGVTVGGLVSVGDATVRTSGGTLGTPITDVNSARSLAGINTLNAFVIGGNTISATAISSQTSCTCPGAICTGGSTIVGLIVNGNPITLTGEGQIVVINGLGTLILNEKIISPGSITVNAFHLIITVDVPGPDPTTDVIIGSSHSDINCAITQSFNAYSGRATGIRNRERTNILIPTDVSVIVADTGFLPTSGGRINVTTVGTTVLPGLLTSGTITSNTAGGLVPAPPPPPFTDVNSSASDSTVEDLSLDVGLVSVDATTVTSNTRCTCSLGVATCTGDSDLVDLSIAPIGIAIDLDFPPNQTIPLLLGLGSITINEHIPSSQPPGPLAEAGITVNALHIRLNVFGLALSDTIIASSHSDIDCGLAPSAANVSVSGQVRDSRGRGIARVTITTTDGNGATRRITTNSFGYYTFEELPAGQIYVFNASHKLYTFEPRVVSVDDNMTGMDFTPVNNGRTKQRQK